MASCAPGSSGGVDAEDAWSVHQSMLERQPERDSSAARPRSRRGEAPDRSQGCWGRTHCAALTVALLVAAAVLLPQAPSQSVSREARGSVVTLTANAGRADPDVPTPTADMKMDMLVGKVLALRAKLEDVRRQVVGLETGLKACSGAEGVAPIVCASFEDVCCNGMCCAPDAICCGPAGAQICCSHGSRCCSEVALCLDMNMSCPATQAATSAWPKLPASTTRGSDVAAAPEMQFKTEPLLDNGTLENGSTSLNATAAVLPPVSDVPSEAEPLPDNSSLGNSTPSTTAAAPPPVGEVQEMLRVAPPPAEVLPSLDDGTGSSDTSSSTTAAPPPALDAADEVVPSRDDDTGGNDTVSSTTAAVQPPLNGTDEAVPSLDNGTGGYDTSSGTTEAAPPPPLDAANKAVPSLDNGTGGNDTSSGTTAAAPPPPLDVANKVVPALDDGADGNDTSTSTTAAAPLALDAADEVLQSAPAKAEPPLNNRTGEDDTAASTTADTSASTTAAALPPLGEEEMLQAAAIEADPPRDNGTLRNDTSGAAARSMLSLGGAQEVAFSTTTASSQRELSRVHVIEVGPSEAEVSKEKAMAEAVRHENATDGEAIFLA